MIQVGKCILLHLLILRLPNLCAPSISRLRSKVRIQKPGNQRHQRTQNHLNSFLVNIRKVMICHSHIDQVRDHNGNKQFKASLRSEPAPPPAPYPLDTAPHTSKAFSYNFHPTPRSLCHILSCLLSWIQFFLSLPCAGYFSGYYSHIQIFRQFHLQRKIKEGPQRSTSQSQMKPTAILL